MSTQPRVTQQPATQPAQDRPQAALTQPHIERLASGLNNAADALKTRQQQLDSQTNQTNQQRVDAARQQRQRERERIVAAARQQQAVNRQRETAIREGDHVVIDTERLPQELRTARLMNEMRRLRQSGAHMQTGRVVQIEGTPEGRVLHIEGPQTRHNVPEPLAVRADHMADELDL